MKCPDHGKPLTAARRGAAGDVGRGRSSNGEAIASAEPPGGELRCPTCHAELMSQSGLESRIAGSTALLQPDPKARVKQRLCPQCTLAMVPLRISKAEAFVERCPSCESYWVEKSDLRTLELYAKSAARQAAYASMSDEEKKELAQGLAEATKVDTGPDVGVAQAALSVATGVPLLDRLQGDRFPWVTLSYAALLAVMYLAFDVKELAYVSGSWDLGAALTSGFAHFSFAHLAGNAAFLVVFGSAAEKKLPRWAYVAAIIALGPFTALVQSIDSEDGTLIGGASGVIAALLGACLFLQPKARVTMFIRLERIYVPLWVYGVFWAGLQWLFWSTGRSGVGWIAHLSGFAAGLAVGFVFSRSPPDSESRRS